MANWLSDAFSFVVIPPGWSIEVQHAALKLNGIF